MTTAEQLAAIVECADSIGWSAREAARYPDEPTSISLHLRRVRRLCILMVERVERVGSGQR